MNPVLIPCTFHWPAPALLTQTKIRDLVLTLDGLLLWSKTVFMVSISDRSLPVVKFGQSLLSKTARSDLPGAPRTDMTTGKYSLRLLTHE